MRNAVIGLIIGIVAGIVLGTTVIAPRLAESVAGAIALAPIPEDAAAPSSAVDDEANPDPSGTGADTATAATPKDTPPAKKVTRLRMASAFAESLKVHGTSAKRLERTVWRISDGQLDLRFYTPGALVADKDALAAVTSGAIDAYFTSMDTLAEREPALTLFAGPPFGSSVAAYLGWISSGGGQRLLDEISGGLEIKTLVCGMVPHAGGGWFQNRVRTSEDLRGLRIRASGIAAQLYRRLGAEVLDLSFADTLLAMESGLLAGAQLSAPHVDLALGVAKSGQTYYVPSWTTPANVFGLNAVRQSMGRPERGAADSGTDGVQRQTSAPPSQRPKPCSSMRLKKSPRPASTYSLGQRKFTTPCVPPGAPKQKNAKAGSQIFSKVLRSYRSFIKGTFRLGRNDAALTE